MSCKTQRVVKYYDRDESGRAPLSSVHYEDAQGRKQGLYLHLYREGDVCTRAHFKDGHHCAEEYCYNWGLRDVFCYDANGERLLTIDGTQWARENPDSLEMVQDDMLTHGVRRANRQHETMYEGDRGHCQSCGTAVVEGESLTSVVNVVRLAPWSSEIKDEDTLGRKWLCGGCASAYVPLVDDNGLLVK